MSSVKSKVMHSGKQVDVEVEVSGSLSTFTKQEENQILALVMMADTSKKHNTSRATGVPQGATGYLHVYGDNTLLAFKSYTAGEIQKDASGTPKMTKKGKIEFVGKKGNVNAGVHKF